MVYKFFSYKGNYVICDLPEMLLISYTFLKQSLPNVNILFDLPTRDSDNTINLITPTQIKELEKNSINLTLNAHSLTEMDNQTFDYYINIISSVTDGVFLSYNHDSEYEYWDDINKMKKKHNSFSNISSQNKINKKFKLISKNKEKFMEGFNSRLVFYEYIYTKN